MARKLDPSNCTLLELAYAQTGSMLRAAQIVAFVIAWGQTRDRLGRSPSVEDYAADWKQPIRSAYREQARFRAAFPGLDSPDPVLDVMEGQRLDATSLGVAA
jgi:hypothetical protein